VSSVSIAEIMMKSSIGKLEIPFDPLSEAEAAGFEMMSFSGKDALPLKKLPYHHRDPFDRMLISQALVQDLPIMTCDRKFSPYGCRLMTTT
ncbi:MAG: type II toxin-antitoxin system VapC family toxin, partial [Kiritimatiellia bacterium]